MAEVRSTDSAKRFVSMPGSRGGQFMNADLLWAMGIPEREINESSAKDDDLSDLFHSSSSGPHLPQSGFARR